MGMVSAESAKNLVYEITGSADTVMGGVSQGSAVAAAPKTYGQVSTKQRWIYSGKN